MLVGKNSSSVIKNYNESELAKQETNDCIVRAISVAYDITYDEAHQIAKEKFKRENRKGTHTIQFYSNKENDGFEINGKTHRLIKPEEIQYTGSIRYTYEKNKNKDHKIRIVVRQLVEKFPKGTFIVLVRKHGFVLKDGIIIGNPSDRTKMKVKVQNLIQIIDSKAAEVSQ